MSDALDEAILKTWADHLSAQLGVLAGSPPGSLVEAADAIGALADNIGIGWVGQAEDLVYPSLSLLAPVAADRMGRAPQDLTLAQPADPDTPTVTGLISIAVVGKPIEHDLVCESTWQRSLLVHAFELAMGALVLEGSGLVTINSSYYHGLPMSFRRVGGVQYADFSGGIARDEYRAIWSVEAWSHEVIDVESARLIDLEVRHQVSQDPSEVPAESQNVFDPTS